MDRFEVRSRFDKTRRKGEMIVGAAVGAGVTARGAINGGADFLIALSAGRLRMMGAPSISSCFPIYEASSFVDDFAVREFSALNDTPVFIGLSAMNPRRAVKDELAKVSDLGFSGVVNWPTTCVLPDNYKDAMELADCGISAELDILHQAKEYGLFSCAFVDTSEQVALANKAGVDMINFCFGWSAGGQLGHTNIQTANEACGMLKAAARKIRPSQHKTYFVIEGGPIVRSSDLNDLFKYVTIDGYVGGSTFDRIAIEEGIKNSVIGFKDAHRKFRATARQEDSRIEFARQIGLQGSSAVILETAGTIKNYVEGGIRTLVLNGEAGTESEKIADRLSRMQSKQGQSKNDKIVWIRCTELTRDQWTQRLFGRDEVNKIGLLGSDMISHLVLVDCDALSPALQNRLARVIQSDRFRPIGQSVKKRSDISIIIVQNGIDKLIDKLRDVLHGAVVDIPPLRHRPQDVPEILDDLLKGIPKHERPILNPGALNVLRSHTWNGNLTEVEAVSKKLLQYPIGRELGEHEIQQVILDTDKSHGVDISEREIIVQTLSLNRFRKGKTAIQLGISRKTLYNRMKKFSIIS